MRTPSSQSVVITHQKGRQCCFSPQSDATMHAPGWREHWSSLAPRLHSPARGRTMPGNRVQRLRQIWRDSGALSIVVGRAPWHRRRNLRQAVKFGQRLDWYHTLVSVRNARCHLKAVMASMCRNSNLRRAGEHLFNAPVCYRMPCCYCALPIVQDHMGILMGRWCKHKPMISFFALWILEPQMVNFADLRFRPKPTADG